MGEEVRKKACEKLVGTMKRKGEGEGSSEPKKKRSRRKKACEKLGGTMKRKGEGVDSSEPKKKRSRKGGNNTIELLREKANIDMAMKQEEQKARWEEHERQTT